MQSIEVFLNKKMDRREFLVYIGMVVLTVIGVRNLISALSTMEHNTVNKNTHSFGSGPYGGLKGGIHG
jgi:putative Mn2+ efflux pump MntP